MNPDPRYLSNLYAKHGLNLRKHIGQYPSWTERARVIVDLDASERRTLEREGDAALDQCLRAKGQYPFPALTITHLKPLHLETDLVRGGRANATVYVDTESPYAALATALNAWLRDCTGVELPVRPASAFREAGLERRHVVVLGAAHENAAATRLTDCYVLNADRRSPGPNGMLLRTAHNPLGLGHNVLQVCCGPQRQKEAMAVLQEAMRCGKGAASLRRVFYIDPDPRGHALARDPARAVRYLIGLGQQGDAARPKLRARTIKGLIRPLGERFDGGTAERDFNNRGPLMVMIQAPDFYARSGHTDYLKLFVGLMWELARYHCNTPGGASMINDMEFCMSWVILQWDSWEESPLLSADQRLVLTNHLLAVLEMCAGYKGARWPTLPGRLPHNHETFGAMTLLFGGRYFKDYYRLPIADKWLEEAHACFHGRIAEHHKYTENANLYQWIVPMHKVVYDRYVGSYDFARKGLLRKMADNIILTTDNFGYPCDFGDAGSPVSGGFFPLKALEVAAAMYDDPRLGWVVAHMTAALPQPELAELESPLAYAPGAGREAPATATPEPALAKMPLEEHIRLENAPELRRSEVFDKIAFRQGWGREDQYLLLEGYYARSHSHFDQGAIIRFNQAGRIWFVDNSYGKPLMAKTLGEAYNRRQRGPEDHNMVHLIGETGELIRPPDFATLRVFEDYDDAALVQIALNGYGGNDWVRTLAWVKGRCFLVVDQVLCQTPLRAVRCQWNMLGRLRAGRGQAVCEQAGVRLFLQWQPELQAEAGTYINADWEAQLKPDIYPYARPPIQKLNQIVERPEPGQTLTFANLFYASAAEQPTLRLAFPAPGVFRVSGPQLHGLAAIGGKRGCSLHLGSDVLEVRLAHAGKLSKTGGR